MLGAHGNGVFGHNRLSSRGVRRDKHGLVVLHMHDSRLLEWVQVEGVLGFKQINKKLCVIFNALFQNTIVGKENIFFYKSDDLIE